MTLKPQANKAPVLAPAPPTWGVLADSGEPATVIRFESADGAYSYPYHALTRWVLQVGEPQTLVIEAGADRVIVRGRELEVVRDALDAGRLRVLRIAEERYFLTEAGVVVAELNVEPSKSEE